MPTWQAAATSVAGSSGSTVLDVTVAHEDRGTGDPRLNVSDDADTVALSAEYDEGRSGCKPRGTVHRRVRRARRAGRQPDRRGEDARAGRRLRQSRATTRLGEPPYGPGVEPGETYDYVLYTQCGVEWAPVDGVWWQTDPLGVAIGSPPDGWGNPLDAGTLAVADDDTATYTSDMGIDVEFRRTDITEAPFTCE